MSFWQIHCGRDEAIPHHPPSSLNCCFDGMEVSGVLLVIVCCKLHLTFVLWSVILCTVAATPAQPTTCNWYFVVELYTNWKKCLIDIETVKTEVKIDIICIIIPHNVKWKTNDLENWKLLTEETSEDVSRSFKIPGNELKLKVFVDIIQNMCGRNGKILV